MRAIKALSQHFVKRSSDSVGPIRGKIWNPIWSSSMNRFPILPNPAFLSLPIQQYVAEIAAQSDRIVVFGDHQWLRSQSGTLPSVAALLSPPDWPGAIIYLDRDKIRRSTYESQHHDPIIAHEITHLQLLTEGWHRIRPNTDTDDQTKEKIRTVENWLTDPVINGRVAVRGFSMKAEIESLAQNYLEELKLKVALNQHMRLAGGIPSINVQTGQRDVISVSDLLANDRTYQIRRLVSLSLEPDISSETKRLLHESFASVFPEFVDLSSHLLRLAQMTGFDTPENYRQTASLCLQAWEVNPTSFSFEPHQQFTPESKQAWLKGMTVEQGSWDG